MPSPTLRSEALHERITLQIEAEKLAAAFQEARAYDDPAIDALEALSAVQYARVLSALDEIAKLHPGYKTQARRARVERLDPTHTRAAMVCVALTGDTERLAAMYTRASDKFGPLLFPNRELQQSAYGTNVFNEADLIDTLSSIYRHLAVTPAFTAK